MNSGLIDCALSAARETRALEISPGAIMKVPEVLRRQFGDRRAAIVADAQTHVYGRQVAEALERGSCDVVTPFVFEDDDLYAEHRFVERLQEWLATHDAVPIAVGAGTINDLVKLASHRCGRRYMCVATAASMDGYTAFGASITYKGSKQTFDCPAPQAVVADLDVLCAAPPEMSASGYADLAAKITAGADWILADSLGVEAIDSTAWELVQRPLRRWLENPSGLRNGNVDSIRNLTEGLMLSGFAMQWTKTSRPASGAEHQFSHLWDMQHHTHRGVAPSHGFKVGIATLAITRLYERLLAMDLTNIDVDAAVAKWPSWDETERAIESLFEIEEIAEKARLETKAKWIEKEQLRVQLKQLVSIWPGLRRKLQQHLVPAGELQRMLREAGAPTDSNEIGITDERLRRSHLMAYYIRRRFTVLDLLMRLGIDL